MTKETRNETFQWSGMRVLWWLCDLTVKVWCGCVNVRGVSQKQA